MPQNFIYDFLDRISIVIWIQEMGDIPNYSSSNFDIRMLDLYNKGVAKDLRTSMSSVKNELSNYIIRDLANIITEYTPLSPQYILIYSDRGGPYSYKKTSVMTNEKGEEIIFDEENIKSYIETTEKIHLGTEMMLSHDPWCPVHLTESSEPKEFIGAISGYHLPFEEEKILPDNFPIVSSPWELSCCSIIIDRIHSFIS
jgi:hypothetical protein